MLGDNIVAESDERFVYDYKEKSWKITGIMYCDSAKEMHIIYLSKEELVAEVANNTPSNTETEVANTSPTV